MKVKILVEFDVDDMEDDGADPEQVAKSAASMAAWNNLTLTKNGQSAVEEVTVHVDGHGECAVRIGEEHE